MRIIVAAAPYFLIVFGVGFLLGPIRVFWVESWVAETIATLCEAPFLLFEIVFAARLVPRISSLSTNIRLLAAS